MCEHLMLRQDAYACPKYNNTRMKCALAIVMHLRTKYSLKEKYMALLFNLYVDPATNQ